MRARDLTWPCTPVRLDTTLREAAELLVRERAPVLVVVSEDGHPLALVPATRVLAAALPDAVRADPLLAAVVGESLDADVRARAALPTYCPSACPRRPSSAPTPHRSRWPRSWNAPAAPSSWSSTTTGTSPTCSAPSTRPPCSSTTSDQRTRSALNGATTGMSAPHERSRRR